MFRKQEVLHRPILTDQGTDFLSHTIRELYELLKVKAIRTSVYHPATDGLCERFNRTLKFMIGKSYTRMLGIGING